MQKQGVIRIHSPSPYENIDCNTAEWLRNLRSLWPQYKHSWVIPDLLFNFFSRSRNPFTAALSLMISCGDFYMGKHNSLTFEIMRNFSNWVEMHNVTEIPKPLKFDAINLVTKQQNLELVKLVVKTFRVKEDKEICVGQVQELVKKQKYKEACQLASALALHDYFGIEEFLVPLIFLDKYCVAEVFLNDSKRHQFELARYLDNLIGKENITEESLAIIGNLNISITKSPFMKYKPLCRLLRKLVKNYNLPATISPNMNLKKGKGVLQFLMQKRYIEKTISKESWTEMVLEALGNDEVLQVELVDHLVFYRDFKEALFWAKKFGIPRNLWPRKLQQFSEATEIPDLRSKSVEKESPEGDRDPAKEAAGSKFHKFPLKESQIKVVDTAESFNNFLLEMTNGVTVIGIDAEWKPSFGLKQTDLALIQVATFHAVYILDLLALMSVPPQPLWTRFANFLFENPKVLKIGFDMRTDLQLVKDTFRKLHCLKLGTETGFLDLAVLWHTLVYNYEFVFPFPSTSETSANLSHLIQMCLGETLDKSNQFSNWENRPLRKSQILYAAIDAYCLLEAYDVMVKEAKCQNIPVSDVIEEILYQSSIKKTTKKKGGKNQNE